MIVSGTWLPRIPYGPGRYPQLAERTRDYMTGAALTVVEADYVCQESLINPYAEELWDWGGLAIPRKIHTYRGQREYEDILSALDPGTAWVQHVHPEKQLSPNKYAVARSLIAEANDKSHLGKYVDNRHLLPRQVCNAEHLLEVAAGYDYRVAIKVSTNESTGGGLSVALCLDKEAVRRVTEEAHPGERFVVESLMNADKNICLGLFVSDAGPTYLGASQQTTDADGVFLGNRSMVGDEQDFASMAASVGERLHQSGYRGFAGADVLVTTTGQFVIDLNARWNASSAVLVHRHNRNDQRHFRSFNRHFDIATYRTMHRSSLKSLIVGGRLLVLSLVVDADRGLVAMNGAIFGDTAIEVKNLSQQLLGHG